ncbi:MAG: DoxX family protein [Proteobacteria bacterium]|nr:DoxX family protein [Pseudomonadota bacterium]MYJ95897.1 DoxX family protein [Pseudomonadota bacterium]
MINAIQSKLEEYTGEILGITRIVAAFMFLQHGTQKMFSFPVAANAPFELLSRGGIAGTIEVIGGILLLIGLYTRPVAFLCSGLMAFAYWLAHAPRGFFLWTVGNGGDAAVLYCFLFLYIAAVGGGKFSVDAARGG